MSRPIVKGTLKTAVEAVPTAPATLPPAPAPVVALPAVSPLESDVALQATVNGHNIAHARHQLSQQLEADLKSAQAWAPTVAQAILAERADAQSKFTHSTATLRTVVGHFNAARTALIARGNTRMEITAIESQLAEIQKRLDSPESIKLSDAELFALEQKRKFLPGMIADMKAKAGKLADEIKSALDGSGIDGELLLKFMKEQAGRQPGAYYPADAALLSLFNTPGVMTLP
jgi:hypothetical protein